MTDDIIAVSTDIASVIVLALLSVVLDWIRRRFKVQVSAELEAALRATVRIGIGRAEEIAAARRKMGAEEVDKSVVAVELIRSRWPDVSEEEARAYIDAELAMMRGVGATGRHVVGEDDQRRRG